jgi:hypothetical protein
MEELRQESESAAQVFKNRMLEMNQARSVKVEANLRIV